jgi:formylglycine-generating enzyme required for sulfatase activity
MALDAAEPPARRLRAAAMLISSDPTDSRLDGIASFVAESIVRIATARPDDYAVCVNLVRPMSAQLISELRGLADRDSLSEAERYTATLFLTEFAELPGDDVEVLTDLLLEVSDRRYALLLETLRPHADGVIARLTAELEQALPHKNSGEGQRQRAVRRRANAALSLVHFGRSEPLWPLLENADDASVRTELIHRFAPLQVPADFVLGQMTVQTDPSVRQALVLALGDYAPTEDSFRERCLPVLQDEFRRHPDAGVHSALGWLLASWGERDSVRDLDAELASRDPSTGRDWYVNGQGMTFAVIRRPELFQMGSPADEHGRSQTERLHWRRIDRDFAIATTEVTRKEFGRFTSAAPSVNYNAPDDYGSDADGPALNVTWVQAVKYCRWLSEQEGFREDEQCYSLDVIAAIEAAIARGVSIDLPPDFLQRPAYRLPTEGEWECSARGGTATPWFIGESPARLAGYGWSVRDADDRTWPVGTLKPNRLGLFDTSGNAWEWCQDYTGNLPRNAESAPFEDVPRTTWHKDGFVLRGGSFVNRPEKLRSAQRDHLDGVHNRNHVVGFRVARTVRLPVSDDALD